MWTEAGRLQFQSFARVLAGSQVSTIEALSPCLCARVGKRVPSTVKLFALRSSREKVCHLSPRLTRKSPLPTAFMCLFFQPSVIFLARSRSHPSRKARERFSSQVNRVARKDERLPSARVRPHAPVSMCLLLKFSSSGGGPPETVNTVKRNTTQGRIR